MKRRGASGTPIAATWAALAWALGAGAGCSPDVANDPVPAAMQFDLQAKPPRAPTPTSLVMNPVTGKVDFSVLGIEIPSDCVTPPTGLSEAECEFDQILETLDGFPTVSPAQAPASAPLDPATLTLGSNVVVVAARSGALVTDVNVGFDSVGREVTIRPKRSWTIGESYWVGVRGYASGVRSADGGRVVGSPTQALLKQETALPCGAASAASLDPACPAFVLLQQSLSTDRTLTPAMVTAMATQSLFQLEAIRQSYRAGWDAMAQVGGLPKSQAAVLWNFPVHSMSVAELDPTVGLVPLVTAPDEIRVAVQGSVDPATVLPFIFSQQYGSVVVMNLTAAAAGDLMRGFPVIDASYIAGEIVIKGGAPFTVGDQYGLFFTNKLHDEQGRPLVPSPVSMLLRLRGTLVDAQGRSTISTVSDSDAAMLEAGRGQLATLFNDPSFAGLTGVTREQLVYCFAFPFQVTP